MMTDVKKLVWKVRAEGRTPSIVEAAEELLPDVVLLDIDHAVIDSNFWSDI